MLVIFSLVLPGNALCREQPIVGDYVVDLHNIPQPFEGAIALTVEIAEN